MSDQCANPRFRNWVKEWMEQAQSMSSKSYYTYKKAYESLDKCTDVFEHPSETTKLAGIGPGLASKLEQSLKKYCKDNNLPMPEVPAKGRRKKATGGGLEDTTTAVKSRPSKPYVPKYRTGGYGILLCLFEMYQVGRENLTRDQICRAAQKHCDTSYTLKEPGSAYTAWSSAKALLEKGYVYKSGSPPKYRLTETGIDLAERLKDPSVFAATQDNGEGSSTSRMMDDAMSTQVRNPSTARLRKKPIGSSTSEILNRTINFDDDTPNELDISLYVPKPSEYHSISINGKTSNNNSAPIEEDSSDILQVLADASRPKKRQRTKNDSTSNEQTYKTKKSTTAGYLDTLLANFEQRGSELDMSNYVTNPSEHESISLGGRTVYNKLIASSAPASRNLPSQNGINSLKSTSFARRVINASDNNNYSDWDTDPLSRSASLSSSSYSTPSSSSNPKKYTTPMSSVLLKNDKDRATKSRKSPYNVDEYDIDLTDSNLPKFQSSQLANLSDNIVDLLSSPEPSPPLRAAQPNNLSFDEDLDLETDYFPVSQSLSKAVNNDTFHYTYLSNEEKDVRSVSKAAFMIDDEKMCLSYRIRFYTSQSNHPKCKDLQQISVDDTHIGCSIGYINELQMDSICPGLPARPVLPLHREEPDDFWPKEKNMTNSQTTMQNDRAESLFSSQVSSQVSSQFISSQQPSLTQTLKEQNEIDYNEILENQSMEALLPHEYEIVLVLDSREVQMKNDRDYIQRTLAERGVSFITRSLDLGDVIWVARKIGSTNQNEELFLDYVVERKRLDDLVHSIRDGRYTEQKTRLKETGAEKVIYVVEEYNRAEAISYGIQAVQTAMSSLQIIDGFFLKTTESIDETIEFLVSASHLINQIYNNTTLYTIPGHIITRQNYLSLKKACKERLNPNSAYLVTYPMYSQLNTKNGRITIHVIFIRMLSTIRGVNTERALSLTKVYPTPNALLRAYSGKTVQQGKMLAKDATQHEIERRRWLPKISERLYNLWGAMTYPAPTEKSDED